MGYPSEQKTCHRDVDHGFGHVDALFVVAHEATPAGRHSCEGALDHPAARQDPFDAADNLDDEVLEFGLVQKLGPVISADGKEVFRSRVRCRRRCCSPSPVHSLDQQRELCGRQGQGAIDDRRPDEPALLQPLGEQV